MTRLSLTSLRRDPGLALAVTAVALAVAIYAPTLGAELVGYDDTWLVADNYVVQQPSAASLHTIFFDLDSPRRFVLSPEYLPVRDLSVMLDFVVWGDRYGGHHLTNVICYVVAIALWFAALVGFGVDRKVAGIAVLLWAVHPSHAESVAWLAERKGLLGVMFAGGTALAFARFRAGGRAAWLVLACALGAAAVWSKAHAAFALAALVPLDVLFPASRVAIRRSLIGVVAIGITSVAAFVPVLALAWTSGVVGGTGAPADRGSMIVGAHGFYLQLAAMLTDNAASYPIATHGPSWIDLVIGGLGLAALLAIAVRWRRHSRTMLAACVLWVFGWLPVSHLILPLDMVIVADRYLLIPSLGFALGVAVGIERIPRRALAHALLAVALLASLLRALDARENWGDRELLWRQAVASNPDDASAWSSYAEAIAGRDPELAAAVVDQGLSHSRGPRLLLRKALLLAARGDRAGSRAAMLDAAQAGDTRAMSNLALFLLEDGKLDEALAWARRGAASTHYEPGQRALGSAALAAKRYDEAKIAFDHAYAMAPRSCVNAYNLAVTELELHHLDRASSLLERCVRDPELAARVRAALDEVSRRR